MQPAAENRRKFPLPYPLSARIATQAGAVDRAGHRLFDFEKPHQQLSAFPWIRSMGSCRRAGEGRGSGGGAARRTRPLAGQDHNPIIAIGADIVECLGQFARWPEPGVANPPWCAMSSAVCRRAAKRTLIPLGVILEPAHAIALRCGLISESPSQDLTGGGLIGPLKLCQNDKSAMLRVIVSCAISRAY